MKNVSLPTIIIVCIVGMASVFACTKTNNISTSAVLTDQEKADLIFLREEEKMARDVYTYLNTKWPHIVFTNISASEQRHFDAIGSLLANYNVADPSAGKANGMFSNAELQATYNELISMGDSSQTKAFIAGATIEDMDIRDIMAFSARAKKADILAVYENLARGSRNHLRAFYRNITAGGENYTPQYITEILFKSIISSPQEPGGRGGMGRP